MRSTLASLVVVVLLAGALTPLAYGQKGMGDPTGVARQIPKPELVTFSGEIVAVETKPCEKTTGHGLVGTHILLKTEKGENLNVHLGWADAVAETAKQLAAGKKVEVTAFRTDKMPEGHHVAQTLKFDGKTVQLRDENLRPVWAGSGPQGSQQPRGRGRGHGRGLGWGWGGGAGYGGGR
jgi:hypothetical protein